MRDHMLCQGEPPPSAPQPMPYTYGPPAYPMVRAEPAAISPFRAAFGGTLGTGAAAALVVAVPVVIVVGAVAYVGWKLWRGVREWQEARRAAKQRKVSGADIGVREVPQAQELGAARSTVGGVETPRTAEAAVAAKPKRVRRRKSAVA